MRFIRGVFTLLLIVVVFLGLWRYVGGGIGITSPGWLRAASDNITDLMRDFGVWVKRQLPKP